MTEGILRFASACILILCIAAGPVDGVSLQFSSGEGGRQTSLQNIFTLDSSTYAFQDVSLDGDKISAGLDASGSGSNNISQSLSGTDYSLHNDVQSVGALSVSSTISASSQAGSLSQDVKGEGSTSLNVLGKNDVSSAGQEASVTGGALYSQQSIYAGDATYSSQNTEIKGQSGQIASGALSEKNVVVAEGSFSGQGILSARLASRAGERAYFTGSAKLDDATILSTDSFNSVYPNSNSQIMGVSGLRLLGDEKSLGSFQASVLNMGLAKNSISDTSAASAKTSSTATAATGGSYASYKLSGFRWNTKNPKIQLYLNPSGLPSGITAASAQSAISSAANTWDSAVSSNLFADGTTVKIDSKKVVDNPFSTKPKRDGYSVHGWKKFGNSFLGLNRWWSNGVKVNGYYSITESDVWYNLDCRWTTNLNTARTTNKIDLQSVALHELGHTVGLDDIYSTKYGGSLSPSDPRTKDLEQAMNLYNGPQRTLGNGDKTGVKKLYGA
ncbi:MAG TPA: matrixin family metalloprotease [Methanothrix sp.]|nr:matrixin family metalloprotease [Methanothrix sp.]